MTIIATGFESLATAAPAASVAPTVQPQEQPQQQASAFESRPLFDGVPSTHKPFNTPFGAPSTATPASAEAASEPDSRRLISDDDINDIDSILNIFKKRG